MNIAVILAEETRVAQKLSKKNDDKHTSGLTANDFLSALSGRLSNCLDDMLDSITTGINAHRKRRNKQPLP